MERKNFTNIEEAISWVKRVIKKTHMADLRYCRGYFKRLTQEPPAKRVQMAFVAGFVHNVIVCYNEDLNYTCNGLIKMVITITRGEGRYNVNVDRK